MLWALYSAEVLMAEPTVIDVRDALTEAALEGLRRTDRIQLGFKDPRTAVLGLWTSDSGEGPSMVLVIRVLPLSGLEMESRDPFDMLGPTRGELWERLAAALRLDDQLYLIDRDRGGIMFSFRQGSSFHANFRMALGAVRWRPAS
jgi:hypothetical protein